MSFPGMGAGGAGMQAGGLPTAAAGMNDQEQNMVRAVSRG